MTHNRGTRRASISATAQAQGRIQELQRALGELDYVSLNNAMTAMVSATRKRRCIFTCGNGGSATTAAHLANDIAKLVAENTSFRPRAWLLGSNLALFTAYSNDISYQVALALELSSVARRGDVVVAISCSGASVNVLRVLETARSLGARSILLTGRPAGPGTTLADIVLMAPASEITIQEDVHLSMCHTLAHMMIAALQQRS